MRVTVQLYPPFNSLFGDKFVSIEMESDIATVKDVIDQLIKYNPKFFEKMRDHNVLKNNYPDAIIVLGGQLAAYDSRVQDESVIKLLYPMCGG